MKSITTFQPQSIKATTSRTNFQPTIPITTATTSFPTPIQPTPNVATQTFQTLTLKPTTSTTDDVPPATPLINPSTFQPTTLETVTSSVSIQTQKQQTITPHISASIFETTATVSFASPTISTPSTASTSPSKGISPGAIGGIVVGVVGGVAFIGCLLFCCLRRRHPEVDPTIKGETGRVIREEFEENGFVARRYAGNYGRASPWELHGARTFGEY